MPLLSSCPQEGSRRQDEVPALLPDYVRENTFAGSRAVGSYQ